MTGHLLSTDEAAVYLGVAAKTLRKWRHEGGGPVAVKLGRRVLYRDVDLARFIDGHREARTRERVS